MGGLAKFILSSRVVGGDMGGLAEMYTQLQKTVGASERVLELLQEKHEAIGSEPEASFATGAKDGPADPDTHVPGEHDYLTGHPSVSEAGRKLAGDIRFEAVNFQYPGRAEVPVLREVSFQVAAGERVALVGPSGAGQSIIASRVLRLDRKSVG